MCMGSKPKPPAPLPPPPPPPPAPPPVAQLTVAADQSPDSNVSSAKRKKEGRASLRVQRQTGIGGSTSAGLSIPKE
jgi:hypothetical protein